MYARMVIGETQSEIQVEEFARIYADEVLPDLKQEPGFASAHFMVEEDGEDCVRYHCSRSYRQFVARTQHLLVGDFVVKLFQDCGGA
jgi:hypothetical protein